MLIKTQKMDASTVFLRTKHEGDKKMFEKLLKPMKIGTLEVENRFVVPAMDSHYTNKEHYFEERAFEYYAARAKGGFGLIITNSIA